ncbi:MAG: type II secretion system protein [Sulfurimonas sp.]|nr:type II secretion system protein [Sulfurimonas sp.]
MTKLRTAFTLIELIFAIVIIGIATLSLPMISQVTAKGSEKSLAQEAIFIAFTEITKVTSSAWDENSRTGTNDFEYVIYASTTEANTSAINDLRGRSGNINILYNNTDGNRTLRPTMVTFDPDDNATGVFREDDIDDYIILTANATGSAGSQTGYKYQYTKDINVTTPASFGTLANDPNIKRIQIGVNDSTGLIVSFYMYATNSGSVANHPWRVLE